MVIEFFYRNFQAMLSNHVDHVFGLLKSNVNTNTSKKMSGLSCISNQKNATAWIAILFAASDCDWESCHLIIVMTLHGSLPTQIGHKPSRDWIQLVGFG